MKARRIFLFLLLTYILSAFLGAILVVVNPSVGADLTSFLKENLPKLEPGFRAFLAIFLHNSQIALLNYLSGLLLGVGPFLLIGINGLILGIFLTYLHIYLSYPFSTLLLAIIPHGIVEIPAFVLSGTAGICFYRALRWKDCDTKFSVRLLLLSIVLLFVAALIEAYLTPRLLGR